MLRQEANKLAINREEKVQTLVSVSKMMGGRGTGPLLKVGLIGRSL